MPSFKGYFETKNLDPFTLEKAYEALKYERGTIGYYDLPNSSLALCSEVKDSLLSNTVFFNTIAVVGIGGSMPKRSFILKIQIPLALRMNLHV